MTNKQEAIKMLKSLKMYIAENNDFAEVEISKIEAIIAFINKNL